MPLLQSLLVQTLKNMSENSDGVGDTIGKAITIYTNTLVPPVVGGLKTAADSVFIEALNKSNFLVPLPPTLGTALDVYKSALAGIMVAKGSGTILASIPPPVPATSIVTPIFAVPQSKDVFAQSFGTALHFWFKTGTVTYTGGAVGFWI